MAMSEAQIAILITAQNQAQAALDRAQKAVAGLGPTAVKTQQQHKRATDEMGKQNTALHKGLELVNRRAETMFKTFESGSFGLNLVSLGLGGIGMAAVGLGMSFNSSMQQAELAFGVLLKGPGEATTAIQALTDVAKNLPFTLTPIIQAGQRLTSAGFKDVPGLITTIADAISATGNISNDSLQSVVSSFVQLRSSGTFSMGVISDLTQAGIPVIRALAQQMGMTEFATSRMLENMSGKVPSDFIIPKILDALKGMTGGLAAKEVNTLAGSITNLQDRFAIFMGSLTGGVTDVAQGAVSGLADMFNNLTDSMKTWDPTVKKTLGFALLLGSAVAGVGGLGGAVPGLGALGSLFGGGAGSAGPMLAIVVTLIGLIALLTPWGAIFGAIKSGIDAIKDAIDRLPHGGGGGGGGAAPGAVTVPIIWGPMPAFPMLSPVAIGVDLRFPPAPDVQAELDRLGTLAKDLVLRLPATGDLQAILDGLGSLAKDVVLRLPIMADLQAMLDKTADLRKALVLTLPGAELVQKMIDLWPVLQKSLNLMPTTPGEIQSQIDVWPNLSKSLGLMPTAAETIQGEIDAYPDFTHKLGLNLPGYEATQSEIDTWVGFMHSLGLMLPTPDDVQGMIDPWADFTHKLGLELPPADVPQGTISLWPDFTHLLNLSLTSPVDLQQLVNIWPNFVHALNLDIPTHDEMQHSITELYKGISFDVGVNIPKLPDVGNTLPKLPALPPGISLGPLPAPVPGNGLGASGGVIGGVYYPPGSALPKFAGGGVVPGPIGSSSLAVVHGGEEVIPFGGRGSGGGLTVNVTVNGPMLGQDLEDVIVNAITLANRRARG